MHKETKKYFPYNLTMMEYAKRYFHHISMPPPQELALTYEKHYFSICFPLFLLWEKFSSKTGPLTKLWIPPIG